MDFARRSKYAAFCLVFGADSLEIRTLKHFIYPSLISVISDKAMGKQTSACIAQTELF
jgi:hypothetical protein